MRHTSTHLKDDVMTTRRPARILPTDAAAEEDGAMMCLLCGELQELGRTARTRHPCPINGPAPRCVCP
jgi:hypothetical protein